MQYLEEVTMMLVLVLLVCHKLSRLGRCYIHLLHSKMHFPSSPPLVKLLLICVTLGVVCGVALSLVYRYQCMYIAPVMHAS